MEISIDAFIKKINDRRKKFKDQWYSYLGYVDGKHVSLMGYNTWLKIFKVDNIQQNTIMDISVKQFNQSLIEGLK